MVISTFLLLIATPVFYWTTVWLAVADSDEALQLRKLEFIQSRLPIFTIDDIQIWNAISRDIQILPATNPMIANDTIFQQTFLDSLEDELEPYRVLHSPILVSGKNFILSVRINLIETEDFLATIALLFAIVIIILLVGMYMINLWQSRTIWKPFYETLGVVERYKIDRHEDFKRKSTGIEEFDRLDQAIAKLIHENISIYDSQREFVENAAHELQTPLAVIQSQIDNMMQREDMTEAQGEFLSLLEASLSRLIHLNKNLLLLSKLESRQFIATGRVSVRKALASRIASFAEQAEWLGIDVEIKQGEDIEIEANETLVEVAISNLLQNSIRHNVRNGRVVLTIANGRLTVANTGNPSPLQVSHLFQRFAKASQSQQGNGLGLSIVKKIADIYGWGIDYDFDGGMHQFKISF